MGTSYSYFPILDRLSEDAVECRRATGEKTLPAQRRMLVLRCRLARRPRSERVYR
jgi:hypothetical protein